MAAVRVVLRFAGLRLTGVRRVHLSAPAGKLVQFNLSDIGEGIREVTVKSWFVKENDVVAQFDEICEVESDKATVSITSRYDGKITRLYHGVGDTALVGKPLLDIDVPDDAAGEPGSTPKPEEQLEQTSVKDESKVTTEQARPDEPILEKNESQATDEEDLNEQFSEKKWNKSLATPAVRRIAMENKIKLADVKGTGKLGRVMKEDILAFLEGSRKEVDTSATTRSPLTTVQKVMTRTMTESLKIPQFVFSDHVDVSKLVKLRSEAKEAANRKHIKLSYLPFFLKAFSNGLSEYPILNSTFDLEREEIVYKKSHNIGVAVDSPMGLVVPNIKNVQKLTVLEIAKELNRLQQMAANMKLAPSDAAGGTFSVSNIGAIAGTTAAPLILPPEVCIVALGRIQKLPRFDAAGNVTPVHILSLSWSADHRIVDGATVARCFQVFQHYVENPAALLLDL